MNQNTSNSIKVQWVKTQLNGKQAISAVEHADAGIGYFVLERSDQKGGWTTFAFRRPMDTPCPEGVAPVMNPGLINKLDGMYNKRHDIIDREAINPVSQKKIDDLRQTLFARKQEATSVHRGSDPATWDK